MLRPAQADLFLHGGDAVDGGLERPAFQQAHGLGDGVDADLVVEGVGDDQVAFERVEAGGVGDGVADGDLLGDGLFAAARRCL